MKEAGIVQANVALVDPLKLGQTTTILVEVEMQSERAEEIDAAERASVATPEVQQCHCIRGAFDFVLVMLVPSMEAYEALTRRFFFGNNNVKRFRTHVIMDRLKVGSLVPLPDLGR
jgi:Lrp/AsnC family transcriptional regulator, leucine-responsive regulatory protein